MEIFRQIWLKDSIFLSISLLKGIVANQMEISMFLVTKLATRNMEIYMLLVATKLLKRNVQMSMFLAKRPINRYLKLIHRKPELTKMINQGHSILYATTHVRT